MSSDQELLRQSSAEEEYEEPWSPRLIDVVAPVFFIIYVGFGSLIYTWAEDWSSWSSIYFCVITLSTVGYGDMTPSSDSMKMFTLLYVYCGLFFFATIIGSLVGRRTEQEDGRDILDTEKNVNSWPKVPIDGGPPKPVRIARGKPKYPDDIRRRWMRIAKVVVVIILLALCATIFFACNEEFSASTAVYFTVVTICTVGYGDIIMSESTSKVFDVFFVLVGVSLMIYVILLCGALFSKKMQRRMFKIFNKKGVTMEVIEAIADPQSNKVQRPDFLAYVLVHSGKVEAIDINMVNKLFDEIDQNKKGTVDVNDLKTYNGSIKNYERGSNSFSSSNSSRNSNST